jgi:hypothetical protein
MFVRMLALPEEVRDFRDLLAALDRHAAAPRPPEVKRDDRVARPDRRRVLRRN